MQPGDHVKVRVFGGRLVDRVVVETVENTVVICKQEEFDQAAKEMRKPEGVGFPAADILFS